MNYVAGIVTGEINKNNDRIFIDDDGSEVYTVPDDDLNVFLRGMAEVFYTMVKREGIENEGQDRFY